MPKPSSATDPTAFLGVFITHPGNFTDHADQARVEPQADAARSTAELGAARAASA
jgi:hypothetical protein